MAFFEDLGKKISETSSGVVKKTKDTAEVVKLSATLADEEKALAKAYSHLGEAYLNAHPEDYDEKLAEFVVQVNESKGKIEKYKTDIYRLKGFIPCQNCGSMVSADTVFCTSCGTRMQPVEEPIVNTNPCKNCGNGLKEGALFCTVCGTKVEEVQPQPETVPVEAPICEPQETVETQISQEPVDELQTEVKAVDEAEICKKCGAFLKDGALFCTSCGTKVETIEEPVVEAVNTEFVIKNICQNCGKELPLAAKFCTSCGTPLN